MTSAPDQIAPAAVETILVVEDEVLIRMPVAQYLRDCGYRVLEAANADEGMAILQKSEITVHVVLSAIVMPGPMNGFGFAQWVRTNRPGVDIILAGTPERAAHAAADLCDDGPMLMKPYEPQIVVDRIKQLVAARQRGSGSATDD
jgi:DNA-binding response OmpR family regulator